MFQVYQLNQGVMMRSS